MIGGFFRVCRSKLAMCHSRKRTSAGIVEAGGRQISSPAGSFPTTRSRLRFPKPGTCRRSWLWESGDIADLLIIAIVTLRLLQSDHDRLGSVRGYLATALAVRTKRTWLV